MDCLTSICKNPEENRNLLYACVLDSHALGNRKFTLKALRWTLERIDTSPHEAFNVPTVFRCVVRLTMAEVEDSEGARSSIESLCGLYERGNGRPVNCGIKIANTLCVPGLAYAKQERQESSGVDENLNTFDVKELDWFVRNCYNAGVRGIVEWSPSTCLRIIQVCTEFTMLYPEDMNSEAAAETIYRRLLCFYASALLCVEMARLASTLERKLRHYALARKYVEDFRVLYVKWNGISESEVLEMKEKFISLLPFDFEGAVGLRDWKALDKLVDEAVSFGTPTVQEGIADLVVSSAAPRNYVQLVLESWTIWLPHPTPTYQTWRGGSDYRYGTAPH